MNEQMHIMLNAERKLPRYDSLEYIAAVFDKNVVVLLIIIGILGTLIDKYIEQIGFAMSLEHLKKTAKTVTA